MKIREMYIANSERVHLVGKFKPTTYTIHETQNFRATAQNERDNLHYNKGTASFHSVVDEKECLRCVPFNTACYHAGTTAGNNTSLSLEICSSGFERDFKATWNNAVEVVARDLKALGWGVDRLRQHNNWSGKDCPKLIRAKGLWDQFKKEVKAKMEYQEKPVEKPCKFPDSQKWVKENKISDGQRPHDNLTREEFWEILYRMNKKGVFEV